MNIWLLAIVKCIVLVCLVRLHHLHIKSFAQTHVTHAHKSYNILLLFVNHTIKRMILGFGNGSGATLNIHRNPIELEHFNVAQCACHTDHTLICTLHTYTYIDQMYLYTYYYYYSRKLYISYLISPMLFHVHISIRFYIDNETLLRLWCCTVYALWYVMKIKMLEWTYLPFDGIAVLTHVTQNKVCCCIDCIKNGQWVWMDAERRQFINFTQCFFFHIVIRDFMNWYWTL